VATPEPSRSAADAAVAGLPALEVAELRHRYGRREALAGVSFRVERGEVFGLLGPNGGGKSTLFRILATLMPTEPGRARIFGQDVAVAADAVRRRVGVVFQHPSVDGKLTVAENLRHHGWLYGLGGRSLAARIDAVLGDFGLAARRHELVEGLSGGLQRRVELAKGLLAIPAVLLLDEPTSGLDPLARRDFLAHLIRLRDTEGVTVVLTTHDMDEAERCDRVAILDEGRLVAVGTPSELKDQVGGDVLVLACEDAPALAGRVAERFGVTARAVDGTVRIERARAHELVPGLVEAHRSEIRSITFGRPTLEDVFVHFTGHRFAAVRDAEAGRVR
jgi:ABC-2 type transport system ATP-binding protein